MMSLGEIFYFPLRAFWRKLKRKEETNEVQKVHETEIDVEILETITGENRENDETQKLATDQTGTHSPIKNQIQEHLDEILDKCFG